VHRKNGILITDAISPIRRNICDDSTCWCLLSVDSSTWEVYTLAAALRGVGSIRRREENLCQ